ncbi:MAG: prepilin peptidase [Patescibacteria group bacterium]
MVYFLLFIIGLAIGSFINVLTFRYQPNQKLFDLKIIGGRSHCMHCAKKLSWYELIPILSFLIQLSKCRNCGQKLSFQYPLIEFLTGLIFVLVPYSIINSQWFIFKTAQLPGYLAVDYLIIAIWLAIFLIFLLLSIIDFRHYIIPDRINLSLAFLGIILMVIKFLSQWSMSQWSFIKHYSLMFGSIDNIWFNHFFAAFIGMAFFGLIIILTKGKAMGWGDFKLIGALGLIFGWPDILMIMFGSFVIGTIFVLPLLVKRQKTMKDIVPFGPFLIVASALVFFFGYNIINGYFQLFNL